MNDSIYPSISILGSTGSVGQQAIDVAMQNGIRVNCISANRNVDLVERQARALCVDACAMADRDAAKELKRRLFGTNIDVYVGTDGICEMATRKYGGREVVLNAIIGASGLRPTLAVVGAGKKLALANKESLVCAGSFVMQLAEAKKAQILPVDSEHCAIFQCLRAGKKEEVKRLLLTASGGPFFGMTREQLKEVTPERALAHPTWNMGAKITVDSATLMNKGFEVIEAVHLFGVSPEQVEVLIHRESIMHSAVEYNDNSVIAQFSVPDMRLCVQYALTHPKRAEAVIPQLDLTKVGALTFQKPDTETFTLLRLALESIAVGGAVPATLNAANEIAVAAFLNKKIGFYDIFEVVEDAVSSLRGKARAAHSIDEIFEFDLLAREAAKELVAKRV
ncbi:MAG: 1-deoxy-D-xylulose-5-phosphate reductoisomerase [Clostridia bacterium]|nr:1-deoxy-D-xylulose-5-phosphate reductoisomerase [Clostridia bacterium]